jgi:hypothetical protein
VGEHHRVIVDVHGPGVRGDLVRRFVRVDGRRQAGADVQELPHPGLAGQVAHDAPEEGTVGPGDVHDARVDGTELVAGRLVDRVVVGAAQPVVPDPGGVRDRGVYSWIVSGHGKSLHELFVKENFRYAATISPLPQAAEECAPLIRGKTEHRADRIHAVADADPAPPHVRHFDAIAQS